MPDIAAMKQAARATWASGDFDAVAELIWEVGGVAAAAAECGPGDRVLDIAAGSGNAAVQAAQRGSDVVASDLTPELFDAGRRQAAAAGVELVELRPDGYGPPGAGAAGPLGRVPRRLPRAHPPLGLGRGRQGRAARGLHGAHGRPIVRIGSRGCA